MPLVRKKTKTILSHRLAETYIGSNLRAALARIGDVFVPPSCPLCRAFLDGQYGVCGACWQSLSFITGPICRVSGHPMAVDLGEATISLAATLHPPPYRMARAAFAYEGSAADLIKRMKFGDRPDLARLLAPHMVRAGGEMMDKRALYVPVPLHRWRLLARRFNQSAELCRALSERTGHGVCVEGLRRIRATRRQVGLTRSGRRRNLRGAFAVAAKKAPFMAGRPIILVDDVFTTGATIEACTRVLLQAGALRVDVLTAARVVMPEHIDLS
ncbi:ComF family protein [Alphaproteobacteria bacterium]|nr:ComF family protein [Alphaproteobacteria bacterium]